MPRLKLYLTYDGTGFNGWQRQLNTPHTFQEILETRLSQISNTRVTTRASGRTDTGVHARIQVAHCDVPPATARLLDIEAGVPGQSRLMHALNRLLPPGLRVLRIELVPDDFHAGQTLKKTYLYFLDPSPVQLPELRRFAWNQRFPIDWETMKHAAPQLVGRHDFKAFCGKGSKVKTTVRTIHEAYWEKILWQGMSGPRPLWVFRVTGSGFLKHMVRSLVGTLVHIGNRKAHPGIIREALDTCDRRVVGPTAPAHGLWLWDILYAPHPFHSPKFAEKPQKP